MAKAKDATKAKKSKAAKAPKTSKAPKLPKTVAGIELPKELREQGAKLLELTKHPLVADIVAAGLVALAGNVRKKAADAQAAAAPAPTPASTDAPKPSGMDDFAKTASSLATLIAARAAEKITAKLTGEKAPEAPVAEAAAVAPKKPAAPKKAAVAKKPAAAKKPAVGKAPAKPRAPRAAKPKTPPA